MTFTVRTRSNLVNSEEFKPFNVCVGSTLPMEQDRAQVIMVCHGNRNMSFDKLTDAKLKMIDANDKTKTFPASHDTTSVSSFIEGFTAPYTMVMPLNFEGSGFKPLTN